MSRDDESLGRVPMYTVRARIGKDGVVLSAVLGGEALLSPSRQSGEVRRLPNLQETAGSRPNYRYYDLDTHGRKRGESTRLAAVNHLLR